MLFSYTRLVIPFISNDFHANDHSILFIDDNTILINHLIFTVNVVKCPFSKLVALRYKDMLCKLALWMIKCEKMPCPYSGGNIIIQKKKKKSLMKCPIGCTYM